MNMTWINENWYLVVSLIVIITMTVVGIVHFSKMPTSKKIDNVKKWMRYAVTEAERELGSNTGQLKLATVYNMALQKFPWIASFISYSQFDEWVKDALEWLNMQLETNPSVRAYVKGE